MREILFRGKRVDNGEWFYGGCCIKNHAWIINIKENGKFKETMVDCETVGQYTGLTDKNGTKIFEGDILEDEKGKRYQITWGYDLSWLAITDEEHGNCYCPKALVEHGAIVIGNIHDRRTNNDR